MYNMLCSQLVSTRPEYYESYSDLQGRDDGPRKIIRRIYADDHFSKVAKDSIRGVSEFGRQLSSGPKPPQ